MNISKPFHKKQTEVCELTRIALRCHTTCVSRIIKIALKLLKQTNPGLQVVVSYADTNQGHVGRIYAASNWIYLGTAQEKYYVIDGIQMHPRSVFSKYGSRSIDYLKNRVKQVSLKCMPVKHKYAWIFDRVLRNEFENKPYPISVESAGGGTLDNQSRGGGSIPTSTLSNRKSPPKLVLKGIKGRRKTKPKLLL